MYEAKLCQWYLWYLLSLYPIKLWSKLPRCISKTFLNMSCSCSWEWTIIQSPKIEVFIVTMSWVLYLLQPEKRGKRRRRRRTWRQLYISTNGFQFQQNLAIISLEYFQKFIFNWKISKKISDRSKNEGFTTDCVNGSELYSQVLGNKRRKQRR